MGRIGALVLLATLSGFAGAARTSSPSAPESQRANDHIVRVATFPFVHRGNTAHAESDAFDSYGCSPHDQSGRENIYRVVLTAPGTLVARVDDGTAVDVDVHLLASLDPDDCLGRGNSGLSRNLSPGIYYLAVDTHVVHGVPQDGPYDLHVHFIGETSVCAMEDQSIPRIGASVPLAMPATGPVVKEAHLVTVEEAATAPFNSRWPKNIEERISEHYRLSQRVSGYATQRTEPWAPCCEPRNAFGQGSSPKPPAIAEAWYLNMRWRRRPPPGQRYIVFDGVSGRAVVAAGGYENGPGDLSRIGGVAEEVHSALGTGHLSTLTVGVAVGGDSLPYGPIDCSMARPGPRRRSSP